MEAQRTPLSSGMISLQDVLIAGDIAARETFWQEVSDQGAPLIAVIEGD